MLLYILALGSPTHPLPPESYRAYCATYSFGVPESPTSWWVTPYHFGIDQGPVVLMVENYRTGLLWNIMRRCPAIVTGLRRAGFAGGWL